MEQINEGSSSSLSLSDFLSKWICFHLKNCHLCPILQLLVSDAQILRTYFQENAFLCNERYATGFFICLSAMELNQSSLLSQVDPTLCYQKFSAKKHRRCSSHPHFSISPKKVSQYISYLQPASIHYRTNEISKNDESTIKNRIKVRKTQEQYRLRSCRSFPDIREHNNLNGLKCKTASKPISIPKKNLRTYSDVNNLFDKAGTSSSNNSKAEEISMKPTKCDNIQIHIYKRSCNITEYDSPSKQLSSNSTNKFLKTENYSFSTSGPTDFMHSFLTREGEKLKNRIQNSVFNDDDVVITEAPHRKSSRIDQSLISFLQSIKFSQNNTDLDRENAHFSISEAMIAVIEHMKCTRFEKGKQKLKNIIHNKGAINNNLEREFSINCHSEYDLKYNDSSFSEVEDLQQDSGNLTDISSCDDAGEELSENLTISTSNRNDYAITMEFSENKFETLSAEKVALSLISKFSDKQLLKAADINWLVSEKDAPQKLLPMPGGFSVDSTENNCMQSFTRGTKDWAPPRPQIIFTNHLSPNRKKLMERQLHRCATCGMRVSSNYMHKYRYCTYLGKYHCTGCHRNQISPIPGKVLEKWDFTYYPVSVFAYRLLEQMWTYPLFYIPDLNPHLYNKIKSLHLCKLKREQLKCIQDFIVTCRFASDQKRLFKTIPSYWATDPDKWSMADFVAAKDGALKKALLNVNKQMEEHIFNCVLCTVRGFICEICPRKQIIYPWQSKIKRCDHCGTCFHFICWKNMAECVKCQRIRSRQQNVSAI